MEQLNSKFDADLKISTVTGKPFNADSIYPQLLQLTTVDVVTRYLEDNALAKYDDAQTLVTVRGVDSLYKYVVPIDDMIRVGRFSTGYGDIEYVSVGMGVAYGLGVNVNLSRRLALYVPTTARTSFLPTPSYREKELLPTSIFMLDAETDERYVVTSLKFAQQLFNREGYISAIGVRVNEGGDIDDVKRDISSIIGSEYSVDTRYEQRKALYEIIENEKRVVFFISILVMVIASFSLIGSLVMLITDKKTQIGTLMVLGARDGFIQRLFFMQGFYISLSGIVFGVVVGVAITLLQQYLGFVSIGSETLLVDSYPVILKWQDVVSVVVSVAVINLGIIYITIRASLSKI